MCNKRSTFYIDFNMNARFFLLSLIILSFNNIQGQVINQRVNITDVKIYPNQIDLYYEFVNYDSKNYEVWVEVITNNGRKITPVSTYGDISHVKPRRNLKITWNIDKDKLMIDEFVQFIIYAKQLEDIKTAKSLIYTTVYPGSGRNSVGGKNNFSTGLIAYAGIGSSLLFNTFAINALEKYKIEPDFEKSKRYYNNAKKFNLVSIASLGIGVSAWLVEYYKIGKTISRTKQQNSNAKNSNINLEKVLTSSSEKVRINTRGLPPILVANLKFTDRNNNGILEAGESADISLEITNEGKGDAGKLTVSLKSDKNDKSIIISDTEKIPRLKSGDAVTINIPITTDLYLKTAEHKIEIKVMEEFGYDMEPAYLIMQTYEHPFPQISFSGYDILDSGEGTAPIIEDGKLQAGEQVILKIIIQNIGQGIAENIRYEIKTNDSNIFLNNEIGLINKMEVGETKDIYINLSPNKRVDYDVYLPIFLTVTENKKMGNLIDYQLPITLNSQPPKVNILKVEADLSSLAVNKPAKFEYNSQRFKVNNSNLHNIRSVIPAKTKRPNSVGVVFGVNNYENMSPAPYADNDAVIMKEYFEKILGVEQVLLFTNKDVSISRLNRMFNPDYGDLKKVITKGETEIFVYFSGHGVPDKSGSNTYLFPYDGIKEDLETFAYNTNILYQNLSKLEAKSVTVILDACFSGSSRKSDLHKEENLVAQKGVRVRPNKPWMNNETFTMITSSSGEETSLGYDHSETGIFTYYFCAGLQGKADYNGDKVITLGELKKYVIENVVDHSKKISGVQTPEFIGDENRILVEL